jgi:HTH-type transcriptional regulator/antitoxin HigA
MNEQPLKLIRTEEQYDSYLQECERLIEKAPAPNSPESDRIDMLSLLIEKYEEQNIAIEPVHPIDAIKFRMDQQGLKQVDLAPYFGTKSRVSEVLSGKRPLTVQMIKALAIGLGISVETLVGLHVNENQSAKTSDSVDWKLFPLSEMISRGWISNIRKKSKGESSVEDRLKQFIGILSSENHRPTAAFKRTLHGEAYSPNKKYSIFAWLSKVVQEAGNTPVTTQFKRESFGKETLKE